MRLSHLAVFLIIAFFRVSEVHTAPLDLPTSPVKYILTLEPVGDDGNPIEGPQVPEEQDGAAEEPGDIAIQEALQMFYLKVYFHHQEARI